MLHDSAKRSLHPFFETLRAAGRGVLALDYDGTLAPFHLDRYAAVPYPGVREVLGRILQTGRTRVVLISGRKAEEVRNLLGIVPAPEIWGVHGRQRLWPDGRSDLVPLKPHEEAALHEATVWVENAGHTPSAEFKPGSLALHWRGRSDDEAARIGAAARAALEPIAARAGMSLLGFDGGVELRANEPNKGSAVRALSAEFVHPTPFAYLGDDTTDEDAFVVLRGTGALSVLVRAEWRETAAEVWIRPPEELLEFLSQWAACSGAAQ
jgi:trehalose 6-phosphate phosphatase